MAANVGQVIASSWETYVGTKPEDNIHDDYFLQAHMKANGGFKSLDGGRDVRASLEYALNPNVGWVTETDQLPIGKPDTFDEANYNWKILAGTASFTEFERAINQGGGQKFDLLEARLENLRQTLFSFVNAMLFGSASGNIPGGLADLVSTTPSTGTVGGINRASFTFWRNNQVTGTQTSTAFDNLRSSLGQAYDLASNGISGQYPDLVVTTQTVYRGYEKLLVANERILRESGSDKGVSGFKPKTLMFRDVPIYWDNDCGSALAYVLNFRNFRLAYPKGFWMKAFPGVDPANQLLEVFKVMTMCVPYTNNSRRLSVVSAIS